MEYRVHFRNPENPDSEDSISDGPAVEMEAAAFFAVAQFRGVMFAQLLYGGDDLGSSEWDDRNWNEQASVREKLFWLAAEACLLL